MAGDWIKVEKCSAGKPEVMRLARLWGVPQDHALGLLVRFWVWIDDACVDGVVDGVASHEIDDLMRFPGFAQGLVSVKWLEIDDVSPCTRIPNFDKHNAETSKKRALRNDRQARWRDGRVDGHVDTTASTKASTREEKKREEKITTKPERDTPLSAASIHGTRLDPNWVLPADWVEWTLQERPDFVSADVERVALVFRDHWHSKAGKDARKTDWFKTWCNWIRREQRHYSKRPDAISERREKQARNIDILTGKVRDERTIEGFAERVGGALVLSLPSGVREPGTDDVEGGGPGRSAAGMGRVSW